MHLGRNLRQGAGARTRRHTLRLRPLRLPEYRLGNIGDTHEGDLAFSEAQKKFAYAKSGTLPGCCKACPYLRLCWGDCPKDRFTTSTDGEPGLHYLCSGLKRFFHKATAARGELARRLQRP